MIEAGNNIASHPLASSGSDTSPRYDAVLLVSFGGPEGPDDVMPFLENVLRGKPVPRARMLEVAEHYAHFGGVSPLNAQNRALLAALERELAARGPRMPVYWGNRNWAPLLPATLDQMRRDGVRRGLGIFTSAFSSYSSCRQYRENIAAAQQAVGPEAPQVDKIRAFYNHPEFIAAWSDRIAAAFAELPPERRAAAELIYTAHSIPQSMADNCRYADQLGDAGALIAAAIGISNWRLAYQSRSGSPTQPWLEPDICDMLVECQSRGVRDVVVAPLGFLSDHMEVLYDLDTEARERAAELSIHMIRSGTVSDHPRFIGMLRDLIAERIEGRADRPALGAFGPSHDVCPANCCLPGSRSPRA